MAYESGKYFELQVNDTALRLDLCETWFEQVTDPRHRPPWLHQAPG